MQTATFFNTIGLGADALTEAKQQADYQGDVVLRFFSDYHYQSFPPSAVLKQLTASGKLGKTTPITSVRRAISVLVKKKKLLKLAQTKIGPHKKPEHLYQINQSTVQS